MADVAFADLVKLYENTTFEAARQSGTLTIQDDDVLRVARLVDQEDAAESAGVTVVGEVSTLAVGQTVAIVCGPPKGSIGFLFTSLDDLLKWPAASIAEPTAYYVIEGRFGPATAPVPADLVAYRTVLGLIRTLADAAAFLDPVRRELMFLKDGRVPIPIRYDTAAIRTVSLDDAASLQAMMVDETHKDQKLAILAEAVVGLVSSQPTDERFRLILRNLATILRQVRDGYRLFASEFSYDKIRNDIEDARLDYLNKIHKTFIDIQGQLLGLPVATVVVASQLKSATACGVDLWSDVAVLGGACIFVTLLVVAIGNQRLTLSAIAAEVTRQKTKMKADYAAISDRFVDVFNALEKRIRWHGYGLNVIGLISLIGAAFATFAFIKLVTVNPLTCVTGAFFTNATSAPAALAPLPANAPAPAAPAVVKPPAAAPFPAPKPAPTPTPP